MRARLPFLSCVVFFFLCCLESPAALYAAPVRLTVVGDSISLGMSLNDDSSLQQSPYWAWFSSTDLIGDVFPGNGGGYQLAVNSRGLNATVRPRTYGGMSEVWFNKTQTRTGMDATGYTHPYAFNPSDDMISSDPDVVFFMLGANDASDYLANGTQWGRPYRDYFRSEYTATLNRLATYVNGRGQHPDVYIGTVTPLRVPPSPGEWWGRTYTQTDIDQRIAIDQIIEDGMNPLIKSVAGQFGFHVADTWAALAATGHPDDFYMDQIHPNQAGRDLYRNTFLNVYEGTTLLPGDATADGTVGGDDYAAWLTNFGVLSANWNQGDFDGDGSVGGSDYAIWLNQFGTSTVGAGGTVPEPACMLVLAAGALATATRRRLRSL